jgi:hypothetical protein
MFRSLPAAGSKMAGSATIVNAGGLFIRRPVWPIGAVRGRPCGI